MDNNNLQGHAGGGDRRTGYVFALLFVLLAAGIVAAGYRYFKSYESSYRSQIERQISVIAELKVGELTGWRQERLGDASTLFNNDAFSVLVRRAFQQPPDVEAQRQLAAWMGKYLGYNQYERVFLLDTRGAVLMAVPDTAESTPPRLVQDTAQALHSGKVAFLDFHREVPDGPIYLAVAAPILDKQDANRPLGVLVLRIDPQTFLYPFIQRWPAPSSTAETLLVRRDGDDALFLNELRFQKNTALSLRVPLTRTDIAAAKAVLGQEGIVEGVDYRGVPVIAALHAIPNSPWFLVARIDTSEVYGPLKERMWMTVALVGALILATGLGAGWVWRRQSVRFFKQRAEAADALLRSETKYRTLFRSAKDAIFLLTDERFVECNPKALEMFGCQAGQIIGRTPFDFSPPRQPNGRASEEMGREIIHAALAGTAQFMEWQHCRLDGTAFDTEVGVNRLDTGGQPMVMAMVRDITESKRAADALRTREEQLAQAVRVARLGVFEHNHLTDKIQWSREMREITGWDPAIEAGLPEWVNLIHPEDRARIAGEIGRAHNPSGDGRYSVEHRIMQSDGSLRWVSVRSQTFFEGQGSARRPVRTIGATLDITEAKWAEAQLQQEQVFNEAILNNVPGMLALYDESGHLVRWNKQHEQITGYSADEIAKMHVLDWLGGREPGTSIIRQEMETIFAQGHATAEADLVTKDGRVLPFLFTGVAINIAGKAYVLGMGIDITRRKQAEEALRKSEEKFRAIADYTYGWENWVGPDGRLRWVNPAVERLTGYTPLEVMAMRDFPLPLIFEEDKQKVQASFQRSIQSRALGSPLEFRILRKDGQVIWGSAVAQTIYDDQGRSMGHRSSILDITDRKRAEEELRRTVEDLRRSNCDLEQFAYVASHDLQEPLRMVISYMDLLERTHKGRIDKDADQFIAFAVEGAHRMRQLISDLLTFSRVTAREIVLRPVAVQKAFDRAMADLRGLIAQTGAEVTHDLLPEVKGDETQLSQILMNLFSNAIKFRGERSPRIHMGANREGAEWVFSVRDNGIGIDSRNFERIFHIFQRLHTRAEYPGSGIGLAICKRIVERHGGRMWVESQAGQGATFFFTVPT